MSASLASLSRPKRDNSDTLARIAGSLAQEEDVKVPYADDDKEFEAPTAKVATPAAKVVAPVSSLEEQARMAYAAIAKPVTEESFVTWYCATQKKSATKRPAETPLTGPVAKKQSVLPGASTPAKPPSGHPDCTMFWRHARLHDVAGL